MTRVVSYVGGLFGAAAAPVATREMKREAIERELRYRRHVYPRRVAAGQMSQAQADHQIWLLDEIRKDYAP